jgi:hypothetical protein
MGRGRAERYIASAPIVSAGVGLIEAMIDSETKNDPLYIVCSVLVPVQGHVIQLVLGMFTTSHSDPS